jgi:hypothetical protein
VLDQFEVDGRISFSVWSSPDRMNLLAVDSWLRLFGVYKVRVELAVKMSLKALSATIFGPLFCVLEARARPSGGG